MKSMEKGTTTDMVMKTINGIATAGKATTGMVDGDLFQISFPELQCGAQRVTSSRTLGQLSRSLRPVHWIPWLAPRSMNWSLG